jgi:epothilone polyketide synthase D
MRGRAITRVTTTGALLCALALPVATAWAGEPAPAACPGPSVTATSPTGRAGSFVDTSTPSTVRKVRFTALDGRALSGLLATPDGSGPFPAVVFVHGGFGVDPKPDTVKKLASAGFVALDPDYRDGDIGGMEVDDVVAAGRFLKAMKNVDPARVAVMGTSHGGTISLLAAERFPSEFRAVVAAASATDWACIWQIKRAEGDPLAGWLERSMGGTPETTWAEYVRRSPVYGAAAVTAPVYLTHSASDPQVPPGQSANMAAALQAASRTVTWQPTSTRGHGFLMVQAASGPDWQGVLAFLVANLES